MQIQQRQNTTTFGWNIKTHSKITQIAVKDNANLSKIEQRWISQASKLPDLMKSEIEDLCSAHFYDALHLDPSFGTKNDDVNNAMSKFLFHTAEALKKNDRFEYLKEIGMAAHYLQDASTPMHVQNGNYLKMLMRLPMHKDFEKGKKLGASSRLDILEGGYKEENLIFSTLKMLFHNTALYTTQPENHVRYKNKSQWGEIQQRCFNRGVNSTKAYLDYILQFLPKANGKTNYAAPKKLHPEKYPGYDIYQ